MSNKAVKDFRRRRYSRLMSRMDADDEGQWITTENGHKVHINEAGEPDMGNAHVLAAMKGENSGGTKGSGSSKRQSKDYEAMRSAAKSLSSKQRHEGLASLWKQYRDPKNEAIQQQLADQIAGFSKGMEDAGDKLNPEDVGVFSQKETGQTVTDNGISPELLGKLTQMSNSRSTSSELAKMEMEVTSELDDMPKGSTIKIGELEVTKGDGGKWTLNDNGNEYNVRNSAAVMKELRYAAREQSQPTPARTTTESVSRLNDMTSGFYGQRQDIYDELEENGFEVIGDYGEKIVVDDNRNESDTQYILEVGGTERSITIDDVKAEKMPDSDDDWEPDDDYEEIGDSSAVPKNPTIKPAANDQPPSVAMAGRTKLDIMKANKADYEWYQGEVSKMSGLEKTVGEKLILPWLKNNNWQGGMSDSQRDRVYDKLIKQGVASSYEEIADEEERQMNKWLDK